MHDTFSYEADYITYEYDENFERSEKHEKKKETTRAVSASYGLKDHAAAEKLINAWAAEDSLTKKGNAWLIQNDNKPVYMILSGNVLTFTEWEKADGQSRPLPEAWERLDAALPAGKLLTEDYGELLSFVFPYYEKTSGLISENVGDLLISQPLIKGQESSCQVRLLMENKKVNALVQLEELYARAASAEN
jgi:hypothetical protein